MSAKNIGIGYQQYYKMNMNMQAIQLLAFPCLCPGLPGLHLTNTLSTLLKQPMGMFTPNL